MQIHQTNFREHQRQARKNSRRLTLVFILGIVLSTIVNFAATWLVYRALCLIVASFTLPSDIFFTTDITIHLGVDVVCLVVSIISALMIVWGFFQKKAELKRKKADSIAASLGAKKLPEQLSLRQQQYVSVVEEMALASGLHPPTALYLPNDESINAFVTGDYGGGAAIAISQGALDYLNREELQALVAHEFGHIFNRDVFLNNRLSAVLHGFFIVKKSISKWGLFVIGVSGVSWVAIFFGKILQAVFSRQREYLADAHAVQYTRNKDALVGVFYKAIALQQMKVITPPVDDNCVHFLFINYQNKWLSTHPPLDKRIECYGKKPLQDDINALIYKMKQRKYEREQAERTQQSASPNTQKRFIAEKFIPLLALREYQQNLKQHPVSSTDEAANAVLAQFIVIGNMPLEEIAKKFKWSEDKSTVIQQKINALNAQHPSTHIQTFLHHLPMLSQYGEKKALIKQINTIIKSDKSFDLCEMSYLLCFRASLQGKPEESARQRDFQQYEKDVAHLLNVVAYISHQYAKGCASNFELMKADAMPMLNAKYRGFYRSLNNENVTALYQGIQNLTYTKAIFRKNLLDAIEKNMLLDRQLSTEQNHLLCALKYFLA